MLNIGLISGVSVTKLPRGSKLAARAFEEVMKSLEREKKEVEEAMRELQSERREFEMEIKHVQLLVAVNDLIRLNVGGQTIATRRGTLSKVPQSKLAKSFDPGSPDRLSPGRDGIYFLDYNPILFSHLLDQLRVMKFNETTVFRPPSSSLSIKPFNQMLRELGLLVPGSSDDDVIALNVGGQKISTLRKTLADHPDPNITILASDSETVKRDRFGRPFIDSNPVEFFPHLHQLNEGNKNIHTSTRTTTTSRGQLQADENFTFLYVSVFIGTLTSTSPTTTTKRKVSAIAPLNNRPVC